jgi:hypothetical protein
MTTITQNIAGLTDPPDPATDVGDTYSDKASVTMIELKTMGDQINTWTGQTNTVASEVNANAVAADADASAASASALAAANSATASAASANYVGAWSSLTGAKTAGISVDHIGALWLLNANTADVTLDVPGTSGKWSRMFGNGQIFQRATNVKFVAEDSGKIFEYTGGTFTQTFDPAATLKENWFIYVRSTGGYVTFDPDAAETIDNTFIGPGEMFLIMYNSSSSFRAIDLTPAPSVLGQTLAFEASGTFTAVKTGWHRVTVVGGGGSGALSWSNVDTQQRATGGGAGGFALKEFWAASGAAYTVTIGAGGTVPANRSTNGVTAGSAGGATTFVGPGVSITCNGGAAGSAVNGTVATTTGAAGGTATGGDVNYTGGASGSVQNTGLGRAASGGGAVGVRATGAASGAVVIGGALLQGASGGAGTGGSSGAVTVTTTSTFSGGGGSAGAGASATNGVGGSFGIGFSSLPVAMLNSAGGGTGTGSPTGNGGGGSGASSSSSGTATLFAGSGGCAAFDTNSNPGSPGRGAGSGASCCLDYSAVTPIAVGKAGGTGLVIVEY